MDLKDVPTVDLLAAIRDRNGVDPEYGKEFRLQVDTKVKALAEVRRLRAVLNDFAKHGTRHDLNPTLNHATRETTAMGYLAYLKSMDKAVRDRAEDALELTPTVFQSEGGDK